MPVKQIKPYQISANGSLNGQILSSNGSAVYWANNTGGGGGPGVNADSSYTWTNTHIFTNQTNSQNDVSGAVIIQGGLAVNNNISTGGRIAFSNSVNITVAYLVYNVSTNSIDTVFGS